MIKPKEHNEKRSEERYGYRCAIIRENLETGMVVIGGTRCLSGASRELYQAWRGWPRLGP
ncbi:MAG: hypothetical protein P8Y40_04820 [Desulfobacterales bacterium]